MAMSKYDPRINFHGIFNVQLYGHDITGISWVDK